jgi:hypothetical protein
MAELKLRLQSGPGMVGVNVPGTGQHALILDSVERGQAFIRDPLPGFRGSAYSVPEVELQRAFERGGGKAMYPAGSAE